MSNPPLTDKERAAYLRKKGWLEHGNLPHVWTWSAPKCGALYQLKDAYDLQLTMNKGKATVHAK